MPSWKKVIISGSDAALNSLDITGDLTVDTNTLYVDSANNRVGIGITSPNYELEVEGSIGVKRVGVAATSTIDMGGNFNFNAYSGYSHVFKQAGSELVRILPSGNVGIGTSSPNLLLEIYSTGANNPATSGTTQSSGGRLRIGRTDGAILDVGSTGAAGLWLQTGNGTNLATTYPLLLNPNGGNVGIGTLSPSVRLHVSSSGIVQRLESTSTYTQLDFYNANYGSTNSRNWAIGANLYNWGDFNIIASATSASAPNSAYTYFTIDNGGNVGIGTTSPGYTLDVNGSMHSTNITIADAIYHEGDTNNYISFGTDTQIFTTAGSERMRITSTGNVGIGVTAASTLLTLSANLNNTVTFARDIDTIGALVHGVGTAGAEMWLHRDDITIGDGDLLGRLNFSGADGGSYVGASILGQASGAWSATNSKSRLIFETTSDGATSPSEKMRIQDNGNVGIGTTSPASLLHIYSTSGLPQGITIEGGDENFVKFIQGAGGVKNWGLITTNLAAGDFGIYQSNSAGGDPFSAGTAKLYFDNSGNVGIGTTSPAVPLQIRDSSVSSGGSAIHAYGYDGAANLYTTRDESPYNTALYLYNNPATGQGYGTGIMFRAKSDTTVSQIQGSIYTTWTTATDASRTSKMVFSTVNSGTSSDKLTILGNGNVGIGTTNPTEKLHIDGNLLVSGIVTAQEFHTEFVSASIIYESGSTKFGDTSDDIHSFTGSIQQSGSDSYFLGDVGIGTTSPNQKLHVVGGTAKIESDGGAAAGATLELKHANNNTTDVCATINMTNNVGGYAAIEGGTTGANNTGYIAFKTDDAGTQGEAMRIIGNGNVGIGTASPTALLHLSSGTPYIYLDDTSTSGTRNRFQILNGDVGTTQTVTFGFDNTSGTNLQEVIAFNESGNVGIGTTSPSYALDIERTTGEVAIQLQARDNTSNSAIYFGDNDDADVGSLIYNQGSNYMSFTTNTGERMRIDSSGNVGIGTTNMYARLNVRATSHTNGISVNRAADNTAALYIGNDGAGTPILAANNADMLFGRDLSGTFTERMRLTNTGNVGIGTTSPSQKLDVAGAISVSGSVIDYDNQAGAIGGLTTVNIISLSPATTSAAFLDYMIIDVNTGTNQRSGTIQTSINPTAGQAVLSEVTTADIGNTSAVTFGITYGTPTNITATNSGPVPYTIKFIVRYF